MRSLIPAALRRAPRIDPAAERVRRDPAPSRWRYRYQRLMLTPLFRATLRLGLPAFAVVFVAGAWFSNAENRARIVAQIETVKTSIQSRPEFMVTGIEITGADIALAGAITQLIDVTFPISSFDLDLPGLRARVTELTAVRDAVVRVGSGGTLGIAVDQRVPVAVWRHSDGLRLIDAEGVMTGMIPSRTDRADLPLIAGDGARDVIAEALALFAAAAPIADRVRGLVRMGERRWDLVLDRDQRVLLPTVDPVAALERVIALDAAQEMLARDIAQVDMRNADRPTVRLNMLAMDQMQRTGGAGQ